MDDLLFGGFLVTREVARPAHLSSGLLPSALVSASSCIGPLIPDAWSCSWVTMPEQERLEGAARFGIGPGQLGPVVTALTELQDVNQILTWSTLVSEDAVRQVLRFIPRETACRVIGLGLRRKHLETLLRDSPKRDAAPEMAAREQAMPTGGVDLGFELLAFGYLNGKAHSWLCNGLETAFNQRFGVAPLPSGFLAEADAEVCVAALAKGEVPAERLLWLPWLIRDYSASFLTFA